MTMGGGILLALLLALLMLDLLSKAFSWSPGKNMMTSLTSNLAMLPNSTGWTSRVLPSSSMTEVRLPKRSARIFRQIASQHTPNWGLGESACLS